MSPGNFVGRIDRRLFLKLFPAAIATGALGAEAGAATAVGRVFDVIGQAFVGRGLLRRALRLKSGVDLGDAVATGRDARLGIHFGRKTTLRLGSDTRIIIDEFIVNSGGVLNLSSGALLLITPAGSFPGGLKIESPFALIAVRGTTFFAGDTGKGFGVFVEMGAVDVTAAGQTVKLRKGEGTDIASPGDPPSPARKWGRKKIDLVMRLVR